MTLTENSISNTVSVKPSSQPLAKIYTHYCSVCNTFNYENSNHVKNSWCWSCECKTDNHLVDGKNLKSLAQFERWRKLKQLLQHG